MPPPSPAKIQLMLRTRSGGRWAVTLSHGMERFIGHYPKVPGISSDSRLLEYRPVPARGSGEPGQPAGRVIPPGARSRSSPSARGSG